MTYSDADKAFRALPADIQARALSRVGKPPRPLSHMEIMLAIGEAVAQERARCTVILQANYTVVGGKPLDPAVINILDAMKEGFGE